MIKMNTPENKTKQKNRKQCRYKLLKPLYKGKLSQEQNKTLCTTI